MKDIAHAIFKGRTVTIDRYQPDPARYEVWHPFFAEPQADEWLQQVGRQVGATVSVDQNKSALYYMKTTLINGELSGIHSQRRLHLSKQHKRHIRSNSAIRLGKLCLPPKF